MRYTRVIELHNAYAFGDAPPPAVTPRLTVAPLLCRTVGGALLTPAEAWALFIGTGVSVVEFFETHRGYTLRGWVRAELTDLDEASREAAADLVIAYARIAEVK